MVIRTHNDPVRKLAKYNQLFFLSFYLIGITCPTPTASTSNFVIFNTPTLAGFTDVNSVTNIVYSRTGVADTTIARTQQQHFVLNFPVGVTQVTATATATNGQQATCTFYAVVTTNGQSKNECLSLILPFSVTKLRDFWGGRKFCQGVIFFSSFNGGGFFSSP